MVLTDVWGCPPGYFLFEMNCYKMFRTAKGFSDAELSCQKEGGSVAKPKTKAQVTISILGIHKIKLFKLK
jgi:hypothetical protein